MFSVSRWCVSSLLVLIAAGTGAEESEIELTAEFLNYLTEFGSEEGELLDPEVVSELMHQSQLDTAQQSPETDEKRPGLVEEVTP